jgi:hypothetical protein
MLGPASPRDVRRTPNGPIVEHWQDNPEVRVAAVLRLR